MQVSRMSKFDKGIYYYCMTHPDDPNNPMFMQSLEEKYGKRRKRDPDLRLVAQAFVLMGARTE